MPASVVDFPLWSFLHEEVTEQGETAKMESAQSVVCNTYNLVLNMLNITRPGRCMIQREPSCNKQLAKPEEYH